MAERPSVAQRVFEAAQPRVAAMGLELVDVELVRENQAGILRLYIDKPGGVGLDDCERVSQMVDPMIDNELNIHSHDYLEVSSPGLERPLKTERDYVRYQGEWVEITLYKAQDGRKKYQGRLAPCTAETIALTLEDGSFLEFPRVQVAKARRLFRE